MHMEVTTADVIADDRLPLALFGGTQAARRISCVELIEDLRDLDKAAPSSICLCTTGASESADSFLLDVALRNAAARDISGIAFKTGRRQVWPSADALASRAGIALFAMPATTSLGDVMLRINSMLVDSAELAIRGAVHLLRASERSSNSGRVDLDSWAHTASRHLNRRVTVARAPGSTPQFTLDGNEHPDSASLADIVSSLALRLLTHEAVSGLELERASERTIASTLAEMIVTHAPSDDLVARANRLGANADGNHIIAKFNVSTDVSWEVGRLASLEDRWRSAARRAVEQEGGRGWTEVALSGAITYLWTGDRDEEPPGHAELRNFAAAVMDALRQDSSSDVWCGVGGTHPGLRGMRASQAEAHAALNHARHRNAPTPVFYDAMGLRRMLVDWSSSEAASQAFKGLLEPLNQLSDKRRQDLLATVIALFEGEGSPSAAARELGIHRNTVNHRFREIYELVDLDGDDPDHRLMMYLAARFWTT